MLIRSGAALNFQTSVQSPVEIALVISSHLVQSGKTALHSASATGSTLCLSALLEAHSDTEVQNRYGNTAVGLAAANNRESALRRLLEAGSNPEHRNVRIEHKLLLCC